jgi:RHS repeat-associated protein
VYDRVSELQFLEERIKEYHLYGSSRLGIIKADRITASNQEGYYTPEILSSADYYPFGLEMQGRSSSPEEYRFGFNGKERDPDMSSLTHYDYGFRIYNPAIGRFLSVDPLTGSYPYLSPFTFSENTPIANIDLDGLEKIYYIEGINGNKIVQNVVDYSVLIKNQDQSGLDNYQKIQPEYIEVRNPIEQWINLKDVWALYQNELAESFQKSQQIRKATIELERQKSFQSNPFWNIYQFQSIAISFVVAVLPEGIEQFVKSIRHGLRYGLSNADEFYHYTNNVPGGRNEAIAIYKTQAKQIAIKNNWKYEPNISKQQDRTFYSDPETGNLFGLDTENGRFEVHNSRGKHLNEIDFSGRVTKEPDSYYDFRR